MTGLTEWLVGLVEGLSLADFASLAVFLWGVVKVSRGRPPRLIKSSRLKHLRGMGVSGSSIKRRADWIASGGQPSVDQELDWLAVELGLPKDKGLAYSADPNQLLGIAAAYSGYAALIERGVLLGDTTAPVMVREVALCRGVAKVTGQAARRIDLRGCWLPLRRSGEEPDLEILGVPAGSRQVGFAARDLDVSHSLERLVLKPEEVNPAGAGRRLQKLHSLSEGDLARLKNELATEHIFDGALPRLTGYRIERDPDSGRERLHLSIAECTYGTVIADHYPLKLTEGQPRQVSGARVGVLTLSTMLITACDHLVFARRAPSSHSHPRKFGPSINGNLEFDSRRGVESDVDGNGTPSLLGALAREGREELGISLHPADLVLTGLGRFNVESEKGTFVLLTAANIDLDLKGLLDRLRHSDPLEGRWELGGSVLALPMPRMPDELDRTVRWLLASREITPHATLAALGAIHVFSGLHVECRVYEPFDLVASAERPSVVRELPIAGSAAE